MPPDLKLVPSDADRILDQLRKVLASAQRTEAEVVEIRKRLAYPVPLPPSRIDRGVAPRDEPVAKNGHRPRRAVHTPAGAAASGRMRRLRVRLDLNQVEFAARLGISGPSVCLIEGGKQGISVQVDAALRRLEEAK